MQSSVTETNDERERERERERDFGSWDQVSVCRHPAALQNIDVAGAFVFIRWNRERERAREREREREGGRERAEIHLARRLDAKTSVLSLH